MKLRKNRNGTLSIDNVNLCYDKEYHSGRYATHSHSISIIALGSVFPSISIIASSNVAFGILTPSNVSYLYIAFNQPIIFFFNFSAFVSKCVCVLVVFLKEASLSFIAHSNSNDTAP